MLDYHYPVREMERVKGIEPSTPSLGNICPTDNIQITRAFSIEIISSAESVPIYTVFKRILNSLVIADISQETDD